MRAALAIHALFTQSMVKKNKKQSSTIGLVLTELNPLHEVAFYCLSGPVLHASKALAVHFALCINGLKAR